MKKYSFLILCLFLSLHGKAIHFFDGTYEAALQKAKAENKNLFVCFSASWCGPCQLMEKIVFPKEKVIKYVDEHYVAVHLDIDFRENSLLYARIRGNNSGVVPYMCILTPEEKVLKEKSGALSFNGMMKFLALDPNVKPIRALLPIEKENEEAIKAQLFRDRTDYTRIVAQAKQENKPMLLYFSSDNCGPCHQMAQTTFQHPRVIEFVRENFVIGYFNVENAQDRLLCMRYYNRNSVIPYFVIVTPQEVIVNKKAGYMDTLAFMAFLHTDTVQSSGLAIMPEKDVTFKVREVDRLLYKQHVALWKLNINSGINVMTLKTSGALSGVDFGYRVGYELGLALAYEMRRFYFAPGLLFVSRGGDHKDITLRQNYLELPVKVGWIFWQPMNNWFASLNLIPYGAIRVGEKLKNGKKLYPDEWFKTSKWDYGTKLSVNLQLSSFGFEIGYNWGLHNISDYSGGKMYNRSFLFNVSMSLGR